MLTTREMATVIWLVAITAIALIKIPGLREPLRDLIGTFFQPILLVPAMLYAAWMAAVVWFAAQVGVWQPSLAKDTLYWAVPGLILLFGATKVATDTKPPTDRALPALRAGRTGRRSHQRLARKGRWRRPSGWGGDCRRNHDDPG